MIVNVTGGTSVSIENNLTTEIAGKALDATQGKILNDNLQNLSSSLSGKATTATYSATLSSSGWSASAPYTQTVAVSGILVSDNPFADVDMSGATGSNGASITEAWGYIGRITANNGSITAYCYEEKPTVNLKVLLKVVR